MGKQLYSFIFMYYRIVTISPLGCCAKLLYFIVFCLPINQLACTQAKTQRQAVARTLKSRDSTLFKKKKKLLTVGGGSQLTRAKQYPQGDSAYPS